jgi:hypothetical protein
VRVRDIDFREAVIHGPEMRDRPSAIHHDNQRSFAADKIDKELEEGVDGECLELLVLVP